MSCLKRNKALKNLQKKGFTISPKSRDHVYLELYHNGKFVTYTKVSHNNDDLRDRLIKEMSIQCKLDKQQFIDLVNCPLSKTEYLKVLEEKHLLD